MFYFVLVFGGILLAVVLSVVAVWMLMRLAKAAERIAKNMDNEKAEKLTSAE